MKVTTDGCVFGAWVADKLQEDNPTSVLDIGAGTGLLSLMLAQKSKADIQAVEIDQGAFEECQQNFQNSEWSERLSSQNISVQDFKCEHRFDVIICNPPFYTGNQLGKSSSKNQAQHANHLNMTDLIDAVKLHLTPTGRFFVMYPENEFTRFMERTQLQDLYCVDSLDVFNNSQKGIFRTLGEFSFDQSELRLSELIIKEIDGQYSLGFRKLLKDYYLHL